jgi:hypothetical protein
MLSPLQLAVTEYLCLGISSRTFAEQNYSTKLSTEAGAEAGMIDATEVANELAQARACRLAAEAASVDIEELLWEMQHSPAVWRRLALTGMHTETESLH